LRVAARAVCAGGPTVGVGAVGACARATLVVGISPIEATLSGHIGSGGVGCSRRRVGRRGRAENGLGVAARAALARGAAPGSWSAGARAGAAGVGGVRGVVAAVAWTLIRGLGGGRHDGWFGDSRLLAPDSTAVRFAPRLALAAPGAKPRDVLAAVASTARGEV